MAQKKFGYGDFFCGNCGAPLEKKATVCPHCKQSYDVSVRCGSINPLGAGGIGWSSETGNPCFGKKQKKNLIASLIFLVVVCVIIFIAMIAVGDLSLDSGGMKIFGGVMAVLWAFWILWMIVKKKKKKDWEGTVQRKEQKEKHYSRKTSGGSYQDSWQMIYTTYLRTTAGQQKKITEIDSRAWYDYLFEGELVRFHGNHMTYYEKYDKSKDIVIPCASCGAMRDTRENYCGRCGCILLKGQPVAPPTAQPVAQPVIQPAPQPAAQPAPQPAPAAPQTGAFCPYCGAKTAPGQKFCEACGGKL